MFNPSVVAQPAAAEVTPVIIEMVMGSRRFSIWPDAEDSPWSTGAAVAARKKVAAVKKRILKLKRVGLRRRVLGCKGEVDETVLGAGGWRRWWC